MENGKDRLTELSNDLLRKIVSLLPIKNALGTVILCKRWKEVFPPWPRRGVLDFNDSCVRSTLSREASPNFIKSCYKILNALDEIDYVRLILHKNYDDQTILNWVSTILNLRIRIFVLSANLNDPFPLLQSFSGHQTLEEMVFQSGSLVIPHGFILPGLKILVLHRVTFADLSVNLLITGCITLEELYFKDCNFLNIEVLKITSNLIKKVAFECGCPGLRLEIDAEQARTFTYKCSDVDELIVCNFLYLDTADIGAFSEYDVTRLVQACSRATSLKLESSTILVMETLTHIPTFPKLTSLELGSLGCSGWTLLPKILKIAPKLEKLTIKDGYIAYSRMPTTSNPPCMDFYLKEVEIWNFREGTNEIKLIEYILENGAVIESIRLHCRHHCNEYALRSVLRTNRKFELIQTDDEILISVSSFELL